MAQIRPRTTWKICGEPGYPLELVRCAKVIAANKIDMATDDDVVAQLVSELPEDREIFAISGGTRMGIEPLLEELWRMLHPEP